MKMTEKQRSWLRGLSLTSVGVGMLMAIAAAGTSDYRDELQYADEETRMREEQRIASNESINKLLGASFVVLVAGAAGIHLTEKKNKQR